jgi:PadR family transcriptional regulator, regulatory protein PadR
MSPSRRPSAQTIAVLAAFAGQPTEWRYGYELGLEVGLKAGSLYPILIRLSERGLLTAEWETDPPEGRPPRHLYRLTEGGVELAGELARSAASAVSAAKPGVGIAGARPAPQVRAVTRQAW